MLSHCHCRWGAVGGAGRLRQGCAACAAYVCECGCAMVEEIVGFGSGYGQRAGWTASRPVPAERRRPRTCAFPWYNRFHRRLMGRDLGGRGWIEYLCGRGKKSCLFGVTCGPGYRVEVGAPYSYYLPVDTPNSLGSEDFLWNTDTQCAEEYQKCRQGDVCGRIPTLVSPL
jgi:hypothetical protein